MSEILGAVDNYEIIKSYPEDKYLPSYLVMARANTVAFHILFGVDIESSAVRVVTAYRPNLSDWESDLKTRRGRT